MGKHKLVPVEPTDEMVRAAEDAYMPFGDMDLAIRMALLAAPDVQGEPVAWMHSDPGRVDVIHDKVRKLLKDSSDNAGYLHRPLDKSERYTIPLYTTPQPSEQQQPYDSAAVRLDKRCREAVAAALGFIRGGDYAWSYLLQQIKDITSAAEAQHPEPISRNLRAVHAMILSALDRDAAGGKAVRGEMAAELRSVLSEQQPAPDVQGEPVGWHTEDHLDDKSATTYSAEVAQRWRDKGWPVWPLYTAPQPAPDVTQLVDALESLIKGYVGLLEAGKDRITSLGGDCDPVPVMEKNDPWLRGARAALTAYRNQGANP